MNQLLYLAPTHKSLPRPLLYLQLFLLEKLAQVLLLSQKPKAKIITNNCGN